MLRIQRRGLGIAGALALCAAFSCARHHGGTGKGGTRSGNAGQPAAAGSSGSGSRSDVPGGSRSDAPRTGGTASGTAGRVAQPIGAGAGGRDGCRPPVGPCFATRAIGIGSGLLHSADVDGDGDEDLIATGLGLGGIWVELGPGSVVSPHDLAYTARGLVGYGDVNGDAIADELSIQSIACGDCEAYLSLQIASGDGDGQFPGHTTERLCEVGFSNWHLWSADLDLDGEMEFLLDSRCGAMSQELRVFDVPLGPMYPVGHTMENLTTADIDGDGIADVIGVEHVPPQPPKLLLLRGDGDLDYRNSITTAELPDTGHALSLHILDVYGDGSRDIAVLVAGGSGDGTLTTLRWTSFGLQPILGAAPLQSAISRLVVTSFDDRCGDELVAFDPPDAQPGMQLTLLDPATGEARAMQFPAGAPPELTAVLSIPGRAPGEHRLFAQTAANDLLEITPSSCGPPTD